MKKRDYISETIMDRIANRGNMLKAIEQVKANKGAPGIDGMTVEELSGHMFQYGAALLRKVKDGTYRPMPVRRVYIPKDGGGKRPLGIPVVRDRMVQQMILNVLDPLIDSHFSDHSYGFRKGRGAHDAIRQVEEYGDEGYIWAVNCDLAKYFDTINHQKLMSYLNYYVKNKALNRLLWAFLEVGVMENGVVVRSEEGTPQGGVISPLLANIYLNILDIELEKRGHKFIRYADDFSIYVKSKRAGERVLESITRFVEKVLRLKVNTQKSGVVLIYRMRVLGFSFMKDEDGVRCRPHWTAKEKFKRRLKQLTSRKSMGSFRNIVRRINQYTRGWINYFGIGKMKSFLKNISGWLNRRLRQLCWKRWKSVKTRNRQLCRLGIDPENAWKLANTRKAYWHSSMNKIIHDAIKVKKLYEWGLLSINDYYAQRYAKG